MKKIVPSIPGCRVTGYLYDSDDPLDLGQDMVEVCGPDGITVDAGWVPEGDPNGAYQIAVTQGMRHLHPPATTKDIDEAARLIADFADQFCVRRPTVESTK
jgi:hypothetical protein